MSISISDCKDWSKEVLIFEYMFKTELARGLMDDMDKAVIRIGYLVGEVERLRDKQAKIFELLLKYTNSGNEDFIDDAIRVCGGGEG